MMFNSQAPAAGQGQSQGQGQNGQFLGMVLDSEESKNIAVVHKTNQGYSGKDLWKLKQERPELFGQGAQSGAQGAQAGAQGGGRRVPQGFQDCREMPGWFFSPERQLFWQQSSGRLSCRDPESGELAELHRGDDLGATLRIRGDAAACAGASAASRHVIISDLHRAAASMKLDFAHHDSPAAMYAVYDGTHAGGGQMAEAAAKGLHVRLLPRLAAHRGRWPNERLERALLESVELLARELGAESGLGLAVALLLGGRLTLAASGGALCVLFGGEGVADGSMDNLEVLSEAGSGARPTTHCAVLGDSHLGVLLAAAPLRRAGLSAERMRTLSRAHVAAERPRAACVAVLEAARADGAAPPLVAAAVRMGWAPRADSAEAPKRPRTEALQKVRCRHILLRHSGCQVTAGERRPKATRTLGEAEVQLLRLLWELALGGPSAFTARCRELSECDTALRGGDLAGDLGWLDRDEKKNRKVPPPVARAAFGLAVGQLSDIVSSERGLHLLLRTA